MLIADGWENLPKQALSGKRHIAALNRFGNEQGGIKALNKSIYRVVQVHRDRYLVRKEEKELYCTLTGSLRYREERTAACGRMGGACLYRFFR